MGWVLVHSAALPAAPARVRLPDGPQQTCPG